MCYVYIIKSMNSNFLYIGSTNNLEGRIEEHNLGRSREQRARSLEKYFKTSSGKTILKK